MDTRGYFNELKGVLDSIPAEAVGELAALIRAAGAEGRFIYLCGNGGSGANASHFTQDLLKCPVKDFEQAAGRYKAMCLSDNLPAVTAYANDLSYDQVFRQPLMNFCRPGDLLIALSGSGNSKNIIEAIKAANALGAKTFAVVGFDGGQVISLAQKAIHIKTGNMQAYEDAAMAVLHSIISSLTNP